jgi:hypothetical protein
MPRIPDDVLNRLKELPIVDFIQSSGVTLKQQGKDYVGLCPMHDDHSPSLVATPDKNIWNCLGACNKGGSTIDWVAASQGVSFRMACDIMLNDPSLISGVQSVKRNTAKKLPSGLKPRKPQFVGHIVESIATQALQSTMSFYNASV